LVEQFIGGQAYRDEGDLIILFIPSGNENRPIITGQTTELYYLGSSISEFKWGMQNIT
jgi:hypothetical protein